MSMVLKTASDEIRTLIEAKVVEIKTDPRFADVFKLHRSLNNLEDLLGETPTPLETLFGLTSGTTATTSKMVSIRHDEYAGYSSLEAAKMYLRKMSDARPFKEIVTAIMQGGGKVESENQLATSLGRSTLDIVKINDAYGWLDNYPHIKAQRKPRKTSEKGGPDKVIILEDNTKSTEGVIA